MLLPLAVWNLEATGVSNFVSGDGVVRIAILEGGWAYSPSVSKRASLLESVLDLEKSKVLASRALVVVYIIQSWI